MKKTISITFDVEPDLHKCRYEGIKIGLKAISSLLEKHNIKGTFFTTCDCIEKYPKIFQNLEKESHEIALHGHRHVRFDDLDPEEKRINIDNSVKVFKKYLKKCPRGFRAPQHSIDKETLNLLGEKGFKYDSSYSPLNFLQLFFFPGRFKSWKNQFFSPRCKHKIKKNLYEIPVSSILFPFVSLLLRIFPRIFLDFYVRILGLFYKNIVFYAHSWDFIKLPESNLDNKFPHNEFIKNLDFLISKMKRNYQVVKMEELI